MAIFDTQQLYTDGSRVDATSGETFVSINPYNGEVLADIQQASRADIDRAVESARREDMGGHDRR